MRQVTFPLTIVSDQFLLKRFLKRAFREKSSQKVMSISIGGDKIFPVSGKILQVQVQVIVNLFLSRG